MNGQNMAYSVIGNGSRFALGALYLMLPILGCRATGAGRAAGGASFVATIGGMSDADRALAPNFYLICEGKDKKAGGLVDGDRVTFEQATDVEVGDRCAMEVRVEAADKLAQLNAWKWFGYEGGKPVVGLIYGSNRGVVDDGRVLKLNLYKLYAIPGDLTVYLKMTLPEGSGVTDKSKASVSLSCDGKQTEAATLKVTSATEAEAELVLVSADWKGQSCQSLTIVSSNKAVLEAKGLTNIKFDPIPTDKKLYIPPSGGSRIVLTKIAEPVSAAGGGQDPCLKSDQGQCLDRRVVKLGWASRAVLRVQAVKDGESKPINYVVTSATAKGIGVLDQGDITVERLTKALRDPGSSSLKINIFKDFDVGQALAAVPLTQDVIDGKGLSDKVVSPDEFKDKKVLHIDQVWVHGWIRVKNPQDLDKESSPRWMARLKVIKDGNTYEFIVGGAQKYFVSKGKAKVERQGTEYDVYYAWPELAVDLEDGGSDLWRVYGVTGSPMADKERCREAPLSYYLGTVGAMTESALSGKDGVPVLDGCEIKGDQWVDSLKSAWAYSEIYQFRWGQLP